MDRILELLIRWEEAVARGESITLESLCDDSPEALPEVRHSIQRLSELDRVLDLGEETQPIESAEGLRQAALRAIPGDEILVELGHGGMGTVYLAEHRLLQRRVAIKVLRPDRSPSDSRLRRVVREAQALARLRHPNIVTVHDARFQDGQFFFVMELVEGM